MLIVDERQLSSESDSLDVKSQLNSDGGGSYKSEKIENEARQKVFAEQKQRENMMLERMFQFGHVVQTICFDISTKKYQSFCRGEANVIFDMCTDYWNGEKIMPVKKHVAQSIRDILFQWQAQDFVAVGFSYKPVTPDVLKLMQENKFREQTKEVRETLENFQKN